MESAQSDLVPSVGHTEGVTTPAAPPAEAQVAEVRELLDQGKVAGFVSSEDVTAALIAAELPPESMDVVLRMLAEHGVQIVDGADDEDDDEPPTGKAADGDPADAADRERT